ncbi:putative GTPase-activating protein GYP5 [Blattamonas nauphoetae]|uniref:GTPase-activating protein GYP5 n=1 Tax=Blattamonas nauphoetae TaxID=2049346 RepID=A0ABQ9YM86_9EUKA|nr:putative GTPase-activating protein GYP5 [Blattamonas nauphoetae]
MSSNADQAGRVQTTIGPAPSPDASAQRPKRVDRYGFRIDQLTEVKPDEKARQTELRRVKKWQAMFRDWDRFSTKNLKKLKQRVRKGIPDKIRGEAWWKLADVDSFVNTKLKNVVFEDLLAIPSEHDEQIRKDITRTFPEHADLSPTSISSEEGDSTGATKLLHTLHAYAVYDPSLGYCQGIAFIAACLNMYFSAHHSFVLLTRLFDSTPPNNKSLPKYGLRGMYIADFPMLDASLFVFESLLKQFCKSEYAHLHFLAANSPIIPSSGIDWELKPPPLSVQKERAKNSPLLCGEMVRVFANQWFLTLFFYAFPFRTCIRILDCFIADGTKALFRVALAFIQLIGTPLKKYKSFEELLPALLREFQPIRGDGDMLIKTAYSFSLSHRHVERSLAAFWKAQGKSPKKLWDVSVQDPPLTGQVKTDPQPTQDNLEGDNLREQKEIDENVRREEEPKDGTEMEEAPKEETKMEEEAPKEETKMEEEAPKEETKMEEEKEVKEETEEDEKKDEEENEKASEQKGEDKVDEERQEGTSLG